jgi:Tfp pilus assembly protein PilN
LVIFLSVVSLVFIASATSQANNKSAAIQIEINGQTQQEQKLRERADVVRNSLTVDQQQTLTAAHGLVDRKRFSWSRLFADLEAALPGKVKVSRISVRDVAAPDNQTIAELDLAVFAKEPATITDMISDMERSGIFKANLRSQNLQKGRAEAGTEYELDVIYTPRPGAPIKPEPASVASAETSGGPQ